MSSPRSQELMNKNSQHEFRFTSQDGLQIACTRRQSRGPARGVVQFMNDPLCFPTLQPKSTESFLAASARLADTDALSKIDRKSTRLNSVTRSSRMPSSP